MHKVKTLICDIDGCLADFNDPFRKTLENLLGPRGSYTEALTHWSWPRALGYTRAEEDQAWAKVDEFWWLGLPALEGARAALCEMADMCRKHRDFVVYFVTGRHSWTQRASSMWLAKNGFYDASVICTSDKAALAKVLGKGGLVAVIEDKPSILYDYYLTKTIRPIYIMDQPYNREASATMPPFSDWSTHRVHSALDAVLDLNIRWYPETEAASRV